MKKQYFGLIILLTLILVVISSFVLYNQWPIIVGQRVILSTRPVDPFDPFMGQYMQIGYEIARIRETSGFEEGDTIYVSLEKDNQNIWRYNKTSSSKPRTGTFIKGVVTNSHNGGDIIITYGIEQFYFERNAKVPTNNITVEIAIANSGRAKLIQLLQHGKPVEIEYSDLDIAS